MKTKNELSVLSNGKNSEIKYVESFLKTNKTKTVL